MGSKEHCEVNFLIKDRFFPNLEFVRSKCTRTYLRNDHKKEATREELPTYVEVEHTTDCINHQLSMLN